MALRDIQSWHDEKFALSWRPATCLPGNVAGVSTLIKKYGTVLHFSINYICPREKDVAPPPVVGHPDSLRENAGTLDHGFTKH